jgi:beta-glucosidase
MQKPDVAVVVFGEDPYAEFKGDRKTTAFSATNPRSLDLLRRLQRDRIPVVSVFLSGRPLWINPEMEASNAFVAAFLPGSEGGGVAYLLFRKPDGSINVDFRGRLSFSWPRIADQVVNRGDATYTPLFPYGFGLSYAAAPVP